MLVLFVQYVTVNFLTNFKIVLGKLQHNIIKFRDSARANHDAFMAARPTVVDNHGNAVCKDLSRPDTLQSNAVHEGQDRDSHRADLDTVMAARPMVVDNDENAVRKGPSQPDKLRSNTVHTSQDRDSPRADHDVVMAAR